MSDDPWKTAEPLIVEWLNRATTSRKIHGFAARRFRALNLWLGVPAVILSTVVGTTVFATLEKQVELGWRLAVGAISIAAAVLTSLQTFLRFGERAEQHRLAASKYSAVRRQMEQILALPAGSRGDPKALLEELRNRLDALAIEVPPVIRPASFPVPAKVAEPDVNRVQTRV